MTTDLPEQPLDRFDRIWTGWDEQVPPPDRVAPRREDRARFLGALRRAVEQAPVARVLEVGCGSAIDLCLLAEGTGPARLVGVDISGAAIRVARRFAQLLHAPIGLTRADGAQLPFRDRTFGLVYSQGLIEHFVEPRPALSEQVRVLAPRGRLVVNVPQAWAGYTLWKHLAIRRGRWPWGWEGQFTARRLLDLGRGLALQPLEVFGYQYWRSWGEPAWVLRDLWGKFQRRNPLAPAFPFPQVTRLYDGAWSWLERRYGHLFLQNLVVVFEKVDESP